MNRRAWIHIQPAVSLLFVFLLLLNSSLTSGTPTASGDSVMPAFKKMEYAYTMNVGARPMLFWISWRNVGGGRISWIEKTDGGKGLELLIGSDPARAPRPVRERISWIRAFSSAPRLRPLPKRAPTATLSATVISRKGRTIWCVRTSPLETTWSLRRPDSSSPRKRTLPAVTSRLYASDEIEYFAWLRSAAFDRDVNFDNAYQHFYDAGVSKSAEFHETFLERTNEIGRRINYAPPGSAILWAPFYAIGHLAALADWTDRIKAGKLATGSRLPPERELSQALGVNRMTLRQALNMLDVMPRAELPIETDGSPWNGGGGCMPGIAWLPVRKSWSDRPTRTSRRFRQ